MFLFFIIGDVSTYIYIFWSDGTLKQCVIVGVRNFLCVGLVRLICLPLIQSSFCCFLCPEKSGEKLVGNNIV